MAGAGIGSALIADHALSAADFLKPLRVVNPLTGYPNRDWEKVYRDLYHSDSSFVFLCAPNDTHNCLLRGHVKNGVVTRISPTYGYHKATDLGGNRASQRWDPRCCQKGLALVRRIYGDRRCKRPMVRQRVQTVGRRRLSPGPRNRAGRREVPQTGRGPVGHGELGRGLPSLGRRPGQHRPHLQRRRGPGAAPQTGLRPADGRGNRRRRHPGPEVPRRHAAARDDPGLRPVPAGQRDGPARRHDPRPRRRGIGRRARLGQLLVAHRSAPGPPHGDRPADRRLRSLQRRARRPRASSGG